jgi:type IV fimbrial biogenesis protein FimT
MLEAPCLSKHSGFSLVELMVAIVIFSIALSLGVSSYRAWVQNTQIRTAAQSLLSGIQRARAEAVRLNANVYFVMESKGYFNLAGNGSGWTVASGVPVVHANGVADPAYIDQRSSSEGSNNVLVAIQPADAKMLTFSGLGTLTTNTDGPPITQITVQTSQTLTSDTRNVRVTVSSTGAAALSACNPNLAAGTTGAC